MKFIEFTLDDSSERKIMVDASLIQGLEGDEKGCTIYVTIECFTEKHFFVKESYEQASALLKNI